MTTLHEDQVAVLLGRFPAPQTLRRSVKKWLAMAAIGIGFVAAGIAFICSPQSFRDDSTGFASLLVSLRLARDTAQAIVELGWVTLAFFGTGTILSIVALLPGADELTLDIDGFVVRNLFRRRRHRWPDVGEFKAVDVSYGAGSRKSVGFNDHSTGVGKLAAINVKLTGRNSGLPDTYGLSADELAQLMSLWRERAQQGKP